MTRFIASSALYYSCSANHNKQDMKSNHTDNVMEKQAPASSLTLSFAIMLETTAPPSPRELRILFVQRRLGALVSFPPFLKHQFCWESWVYLCHYQKAQPTAGDKPSRVNPAAVVGVSRGDEAGPQLSLRDFSFAMLQPTLKTS